MQYFQANGFRHQIRNLTRGDHQILDDAFSNVDITSRSGAILFLKTHWDAFSKLSLCSQTPSHRERLARMCDALKSDLETLGVTPVPSLVPALSAAHHLAMSYMLEGSRMGTEVLRRQWIKTQNDDVLAAKHYFSLRAEPENWRHVCAELDGIEEGSDEAFSIIADTKRMFRLFAMCFENANHATMEKCDG